VLASTLAQSSGSPRLDAAALAHALARWRFTPALKDGVAVEEERDISVRFELSLAG
jgi:TonB family protein